MRNLSYPGKLASELKYLAVKKVFESSRSWHKKEVNHGF